MGVAGWGMDGQMVRGYSRVILFYEIILRVKTSLDKTELFGFEALVPKYRESQVHSRLIFFFWAAYLALILKIQPENFANKKESKKTHFNLVSKR